MRTHALAFVAVLGLLSGCFTPIELRPQPDRWIGDLDAEIAKRPLALEQNFRSDELFRSASSSLHLVQVRGDLRPHLHRRHEETATILRGNGVMTIAGEQTRVGPGFTMRIPAGFVHAFRFEGEDVCVVLVSFSPPWDGEDRVFVE